MELFPMILVRAAGLPFNSWQLINSGQQLFVAPESVVQASAMRLQEAFDQALQALSASDLRTDLYNARKHFFQKQKVPSEKLISELSAQTEHPSIQAWLGQLNEWKVLLDQKKAFDDQYKAALEAAWQGLQQVAAKDQFQRSLLFASHDLLKRLPDFCQQPVQEFTAKDRQTALAVYQYLCRSVFKTSPLGRFTTVQLWRLGQPQQLEFHSEKVAVTPNVAILPGLYEILLTDAAFYSSLELALNPCIGSDADDNAPLSWLYFDGEQEAFQQMEPNPVVAAIIGLLIAQHRKLPYSALIVRLSESVDADNEQLEVLVRQLISIGLLEWQLPEKGLSPSWCTQLCQYLSFLPSSPLLTAAAFLLQSLRVSARAMSFQTLEEAQKTQQDATRQMAQFFLQHGAVVPPIPAEQIFFEDMERSIEIHCPGNAMEGFAADLAQCWHAASRRPLPGFRARLFQFAATYLAQGQVVDFQQFCKDFFEFEPGAETVSTGLSTDKIGALLQVYQDGETYKAVVNGLFPGGGKLFARWMHLFPADFQDALQNWSDPDTLLFPWQGWSNANFQSVQSDIALLVPDGRVGRPSAKTQLILSDIAVRSTENGPELLDKTSKKKVVFTDLGLEAPESRPPVMQVLWHLGVPYVSAQALLEQWPDWETLPMGIRRRSRVEYHSLVLCRASWEIPTAYFIYTTVQSPSERYQVIRARLEAAGVPRFFFGRAHQMRTKPQFFDIQNPVSMLVFDKLLASEPKTGIYIEEMLPTPEQWVMGAPEKYAGEFVLECKV